MMKDSQKIEFAAIVVYRLDRISRNIGDFAKLIEDLGDRHIDFISIREQFDTSSPMGRAMMYIASVFSQLERETIAERIRDNMHELSKTGRWLGGTTPTGYASESLSSVTVDGKVKKACKLKPIPEEIQLVKTIFEVFMESGSLSKTDQYLLEHRCVTKRGKQFTRFAIRGILTNPVYMIADETAYQYLKENNVDLFAEHSEFDGEHGIMAYNRTLQRPGKANQIRPMEEWIVAVGKHPGIIAGSDWVRVQAMLDVNKSKSYRRPRSNVALLSGLLRCGECGDYMRPKLTNRRTADGELIYTYMCSTKERSHGTVCAMKNCNGNTLDAKIIEEIRKLSADKETLTRLLAQTKKVISGSKEGYDAELATGPSATGSEKGTPISIISAPASSIRDKCVQKDSLSGNPAVMKGITARLPRAWALSTAFCNGDFCILFMEECGLKIQIFFNDSQVLVSAAGEIDQNVPPLRQFLRMVQHPGHGMGGFQRRNDSFLPGERLESV